MEKASEIHANGNFNKITNINNMEVKGNFIINGVVQSETTPCILFLRVDKKSGEGIYRLRLELKTPDYEDCITEEPAIAIEKGFFKLIKELENTRKLDGSIRKDGVLGLGWDIRQTEQEAGRQIYRKFFQGNIGETFGDFYNLLCSSKVSSLTLAISSDSPEILDIPFEIMRRDEYFVLGRINFKLVRTNVENLNAFKISALEGAAPPLRILFVVSLPENISAEQRFIKIEEEQKKLLKDLGNLTSGAEKKIIVDFLDIASLKEIRDALEEGQHNILHVSCHGSHEEGEGKLCLENEDGEECMVSGQELAEVLKPFSSLKLVVVSACETGRAEFGGVAGALVQGGMPAVIAMRYSVTDQAAMAFTSRFYECICKGMSLDISIFNARNAVFQLQKEDYNHASEWSTPFLYINQEVRLLLDHSKKKENMLDSRKTGGRVKGSNYSVGEFIGRRRLVAMLGQYLKNGKRAVRLQGPGGIGKTTLALRFAMNYKRKSYTTIQLAGEISENTVLQKFAAAARDEDSKAVNEVISDSDMSPVEKLDEIINNYLKDEKLIIIFDNFEDNQGEDYEISLPSLKEFLVYMCENLPEDFFVIFTTRYAFNEPVVEKIPLDDMNFPDTFRLMSRMKRLSELELRQKEEVNKTIGGHPAALQLLEACLASSAKWEDVKGNFSVVAEKLDKEGSRNKNNKILFDILWGKLDKEQQAVLTQAAAFRTVQCVEGLGEAIGTGAGPAQALEAASRLSLVYVGREKVNREDGSCEEERFHVHRLISGYILDKGGEEERKAVHIKAGEYHLKLFENGNSANWIEDVLEARWQFIQAGEYDRALETTFELDDLAEKGFAEMVLELYDEFQNSTIGEGNRSALYHQRGIIYQERGDYETALEYYKKSLGIKEKIGDIKGAGGSYHQIGIIYHERGDYETALEYYKKSLEIDEKIGDIKGAGNSYGQIGRLHQDKGDYVGALDYLLKAYIIFKRIGSPNLKIAQNVISELREQMPQDEFNRILVEYGIEPDEIGEDEGISLQEFLSQLNNAVVSAKEEEDKSGLIEQINNIIAQVEDDALKAYFAMLIDHLSGEDYTQHKDKVPEELFGMFEECLRRG